MTDGTASFKLMCELTTRKMVRGPGDVGQFPLSEDQIEQVKTALHAEPLSAAEKQMFEERTKKEEVEASHMEKGLAFYDGMQGVIAKENLESAKLCIEAMKILLIQANNVE
eukprot:CAMPEP_0181335866 /NCGR_PEP_ID=MMETSP1101-20121128/27083_1 /TAXON_ID=46948 /ORGANISM="Rhodomonas abbreviata, Strain Caron Lab Isolate" /LENGTH=110 /DNA_ID=CAMNT_0023446061 /DNA_START=271 /DNA_END=603 /DNA_ORIENTATION=+